MELEFAYRDALLSTMSFLNLFDEAPTIISSIGPGNNDPNSTKNEHDDVDSRAPLHGQKHF